MYNSNYDERKSETDSSRNNSETDRRNNFDQNDNSVNSRRQFSSGFERNFGGQRERKPYSGRSSYDKPYQNKSYSDRPHRPYGDRQFNSDRPRWSDNNREDRKPFGENQERRSFNNGGERRPFSERRSFDNGERRPYSNNGERRSFNKPYNDRNTNGEGRSFGQSQRDDQQRDYRSFSERPRRNDRPYSNDRPHSNDRPYRNNQDRPYRSEGFYSDQERPRRNYDRYSDRKPSRRFDSERHEGFDKNTNGKKKRPRISNSTGYRAYEPDITSLNEPIRLNRFIANTGLCSRREADKYIQAGLITVNGNIVTELGVKVLPTDDVRYNQERLNPEKKVYLLLNKPKDYVTSVEDPQARKTVMKLVENACKERIYPVGRLDRMTTGVLLFTNDGSLALKLTHPSNNIHKIYQVTLNKKLQLGDFQKIAGGITLEDGPITPDEIAYIDEEKRDIGIEIHSGKNRIVRRIFESMDYNVTRLDRVCFAGITKKGLTRGKWRFLTPAEVSRLKMMPGREEKDTSSQRDLED